MAETFTYPDGDLDDGDRLLSLLGSFWNGTYAGAHLVSSVLQARAALERQTDDDRAELFDAVGRRTLRAYHRERWRPLTLSEADRNDPGYALHRYGNAGLAFGGPLAFGVPPDRPMHAWAVPGALAAVPLVTNRITSPSLTLVSGIDYVLDDGYLVFRENPFEDPRVEVRDIMSDGALADREAVLWLCGASYDHDAVYRQFGHALGFRLPTSEAYLALVNAMLDAITQGPSSESIRMAWSAVTGVPLALGEETVESWAAEADGSTVVITDRNVYRFASTAAVTVVPGNTLRRGDPMTDALTFHEFNRGQVPEGVRALALGRGVLAAGYFGDLTFENVEVPLKVSHDADGYARVAFQVGGWPADVEQFFDELHARGRAEGVTLAHLLDLRPIESREGEPDALALPPVNPLQFLCENVLRDNAFAVRIRASACTGGVGVEAARVLRRVLPPQTLMIVLVELAYADGPLTMEGPGDAASPGYQESAQVYLGEVFSETVSPLSLVTEAVRVRQIGGRCV